MGFEGFPFIIGWELTLACNLKCAHCASDAGKPRDAELSLEECLAVCDQLPDLLVQEVDFTGGEPLLRPDWRQIARKLNNLHIKTRLVSNGLLITEEVAGQLQESGINAVGISIDGLELNHDRIRGGSGLFERAVAAIRRLMAVGLTVVVITTVNKLNISDLEHLSEYLRSIGVRDWQVQPFFPLGRTPQIDMDLCEKDYLRFGEFVSDFVQRQDKGDFTLRLSDSYGYFSELDKRRNPWRGCPAGIVSLGITSEGKIKGCLSLPDNLIEGDLRNNDIWNIWFSPNSFIDNRNFSIADLGPNCQGCEYGSYCKGGCSSMSYRAGNTYHNNPYCFTRILKNGAL